MTEEIFTLFNKMQAMLNGFIILLPNMVLALIVFAIFFFVARAIKKVVRLTKAGSTKPAPAAEG